MLSSLTPRDLIRGLAHLAHMLPAGVANKSSIPYQARSSITQELLIIGALSRDW